ncbi:hypothetical protein [Variovorax sp. dw_954]|uniref:hypothetical protein n=1 Tax=Variovorax sp. dw_954 TaxID=2720078 RepID=UPI001BD2F45D|nr:hypothetical protein [Variovorax sp. dw_954]
MKSARVLCLAAVALGGCARPAAPVQVEKVKRVEAAVQPSDEAGVADCQYVGTAMGSSGLYGADAGLGDRNARADALQKARLLGANRVVWIPAAQGHHNTRALARAYKC